MSDIILYTTLQETLLKDDILQSIRVKVKTEPYTFVQRQVEFKNYRDRENEIKRTWKKNQLD